MEDKYFEEINLSHIFHDLLVKAALHNTSAHFDASFLVFTLMNPIGFQILKFNKFVDNLDVKAFVDDYSTLPCDYKGSPFVHKDHNHIMTDQFKK